MGLENSEKKQEVVDFTPAAAPAKITKLEIPQTVKDYFLAKNIIHSAVGFVLFNAPFFLIYYSGYTALSLFFYTLTVTLVVSILIVTAMTILHKFNAGPPPPTHVVAFQIDQEAVGRMAQGVVAHINCFLRSFNQWRSIAVPAHSIFAVFGFLVAAKITSCIPLMCALYFTGLAAFIVPPVYTANKKVIDGHLEKAKIQAAQTYTQLYEKLPPQLRQAAAKSD